MNYNITLINNLVLTHTNPGQLRLILWSNKSLALSLESFEAPRRTTEGDLF